MENYFACILTSDEIAKHAETDKPINSDLSNISELDSEEYLNFMSLAIYESSATNMPWRYTGICYTRLLYDTDIERFRENFSAALRKIYGAADRDVFYEDFYDLEWLMYIIAPDLRRQFLEFACGSPFEDIRNDAEKFLNETAPPDTDAPYYKYAMAEYVEFQRKLNEYNCK